MPIDSLQPRLRELGRIRMGRRAAKGNPQKLDTFRLTSRTQALIEEAAQMFGGEAKPWENPGEGSQWEVVTERDWFQVYILPPFDLSRNQMFELWSADGPLRRCNGRFTMDGEDCLCAAEFGEDYAVRMEAASKGNACKPTTRLSVLLPGLADLGVWRLETHGYLAAMELAASIGALGWLGADRPIPAILRLEQRRKKMAGQSDRRFAVPVVQFEASLQRALEATGNEDAFSLTRPDRPARQLKASPADSGAIDQTPQKGKAGAEVEAPKTAGEDVPPDADQAHGPDLAVDAEEQSASGWDITEKAAEIRRLCGLIGADSRDAVLKLLGGNPERMTEDQQRRYLTMLERKVRDKEQREAHERIGE